MARRAIWIGRAPDREGAGAREAGGADPFAPVVQHDEQGPQRRPVGAGIDRRDAIAARALRGSSNEKAPPVRALRRLGLDRRGGRAPIGVGAPGRDEARRGGGLAVRVMQQQAIECGSCVRHCVGVRALRAAEHALHLERAAKMAEHIAQGRRSSFCRGAWRHRASARQVRVRAPAALRRRLTASRSAAPLRRLAALRAWRAFRRCRETFRRASRSRRPPHSGRPDGSRISAVRHGRRRRAPATR